MNPAAVLTDFALASTPTSDYAKTLAEAAHSAKNAVDRGKGIRGLSSARHEIYDINPYSIVVKPGLNSRIIASVENQEHIDALARSIAANGVKMPLTVYWEHNAPVLTDGECRLLGTFRAIEVYGAEVVAVPVQTELRSAGEIERLLTQIISNSGKPFNSVETALVYHKLSTLRQTPQMIADRAGVSINKVNYLLDVNKLPDKMKDFILAGKISTSSALEVMHNASSDEAAVRNVEKAIRLAERQGKTKATKRFMEEKPVKRSWKTTIQLILDESNITTAEDTITVAMSSAHYLYLREMLE